MEIVSFSNNGVIDPRVWSTFGVSVKETDNAIGQFGTGLKYAIAVLMREGRSLSIQSGPNTYVFGVNDAVIRGETFSQITCNGDPLPFTTHLGSNWELWQAYREIFSNCLDEGGQIGGEGETVISAELGDIDHSSVFLNRESRRLIHSTGDCDIYAGKSSVIYYKGIRAMDLPQESLYTYDIKRADLTEDRTIKYTFELYQAVSKAAITAVCPDFIYGFLTQTKEFFESSCSFNWCTENPSPGVLEQVRQYRRENIYLHQGMLSKALPALGADQYIPSEMDTMQRRVVEKASEFCALIGHPIQYPIKLVLDLGSGTLAIADKRTKQIYLSDRVLTQGTKQVASTLLEENLHLKEGLQDCTYDMQSYLFDQIITMGERLSGEVL